MRVHTGPRNPTAHSEPGPVMWRAKRAKCHTRSVLSLAAACMHHGALALHSFTAPAADVSGTQVAAGRTHLAAVIELDLDARDVA